jgi:thioredoxin-related protein
MKYLPPLAGLFIVISLFVTGCGESDNGDGVPEGAAALLRDNGLDEWGDSVNFIRGYASGYQAAQEKGRPILLFFGAPRSPFCREMLDETFTDGRVIALSKGFTCIYVDADAEPNICQEFGVEGFPTVQFISARGVPLQRIEGKREPTQMAEQMQAAIETVAASNSSHDLSSGRVY